MVPDDPSSRPTSGAALGPSCARKCSAEEESGILEQADRAVLEAEERIAEQVERIARLRADGHDVAEFEEVLATFRDTLARQRAYRATVSEVLTALT